MQPSSEGRERDEALVRHFGLEATKGSDKASDIGSFRQGIPRFGVDLGSTR